MAQETVPKFSSGTWQRAISTLVYVLGFGLIAIVLHEFFHFVTLRALGGGGIHNLRLGVWLHPFYPITDPFVGGAAQWGIARRGLPACCLLVLGLVEPDFP